MGCGASNLAVADTIQGLPAAPTGHAPLQESRAPPGVVGTFEAIRQTLAFKNLYNLKNDVLGEGAFSVVR